MKENGSPPRLRPGAQVLEVSREKLHVVLPNHTVTFTGHPVTEAVKALITAMDLGLRSVELIQHVSTVASLDSGLVEYVMQMLFSSNCLYSAEMNVDEGSRLGQYFAAIGDDPRAVLESLSAVSLLIVSFDTDQKILERLLMDSGMRPEFVAIRQGTSVAELRERVASQSRNDNSLLISWNLPYRSSGARALNAFALEGHRILFGACEGLIGRIGPYVLPRVTPCLDCLNTRLLTHAGAEELSVESYRLSNDHSVMNAAPTHPAFNDGIAAFFVLEAVQIALNRPPKTLAGVLEYGLADGYSTRRSLLKVPHCNGCWTAVPPKYAWNAVFPSPTVKE